MHQAIGYEYVIKEEEEACRETGCAGRTGAVAFLCLESRLDESCAFLFFFSKQVEPSPLLFYYVVHHQHDEERRTNNEEKERENRSCLLWFSHWSAYLPLFVLCAFEGRRHHAESGRQVAIEMAHFLTHETAKGGFDGASLMQVERVQPYTSGRACAALDQQENSDRVVSRSSRQPLQQRSRHLFVVFLLTHSTQIASSVPSRNLGRHFLPHPLNPKRPHSASSSEKTRSEEIQERYNGRR